MKEIKILSLKPTQFAVGMEEVKYKIKNLKKMSKKHFDECLKEKTIPIILSPFRDIYLVDHHHHLYALWALGLEKVPVKIQADLTSLKCSRKDFWKLMKKSEWVHLYDQFGEGPRNPIYLPQDIRGMADDPYRSLSWMVKEEGGWEDSERSYAEFEWADLFRKQELLDERTEQCFKAAVKKALTLCHSGKCKKLPGYKKG